MTKPSEVPKYIIRQLDQHIARLEKTQKEREARITALRRTRSNLLTKTPPNTAQSKYFKHEDDDNPVE